jgi:hypothetical protein
MNLGPGHLQNEQAMEIMPLFNPNAMEDSTSPPHQAKIAVLGRQ